MFNPIVIDQFVYSILSSSDTHPLVEEIGCGLLREYETAWLWYANKCHSGATGCPSLFLV